MPLALAALALAALSHDDVPEGWAFVDVADTAGVDFVHTFGDDAFSFILEDSGSGAALIDMDGDGLLDLYLVNGAWLEGCSDPKHRPATPATNRLYRNLGEWKFEDVTAAAGVGDTGYGMGASVGDYDGDGDDDLYVLNRGPNVLYRNNGDGTFTDVTSPSGLAATSPLNGQPRWSVNAFFFDPDADGDLDVYEANYLAFDPAFVDPNLPEEYPYPGPESYGGQRSILWVNQGDGTFIDGTETAGLAGFEGKTMGASHGDLDGDGRPDLFEAADDAGNLLFHAQANGTYDEVGLLSGCAFDRDGKSMASMHACIGDIDGDLRLDVFVPDLARGCLYRNLGDLTFEECSTPRGLGEVLDGSGAWGGTFGDFDLDGDLDLVVVLGGAFDLAARERDRLFLNDGNGHFTDVSESLGGYFAEADVSRGAAFGDLDNDGDLDFVVNRKDLGKKARVVRNDLPTGAHWVAIRAARGEAATAAIGATVRLTAGGKTQLRELRRSGSYMSSSEPCARFGLGTNETVERMEVRWPGDSEWTVLTPPAVDTMVTVRHPSANR